MTEDKKPIISIGLLTAPAVIPNFATSENGHNEVAADLLKLFSKVLEETWEKLYEVTQQMMNEIGVEVQTIPPETLTQIMLQALNKKQGDTIQHGVLTQKGKVILDEQAAEQLRKGISINN